MAIAKLSIDLEARLANLQAGLDKAGLLAEQSADRMNGAFKTLQTTIKGAFAGLGLRELIQFFNATVDGVDKLNDLADATGASVENLSALEDIAVRTGTGVDTMGDALVKMNKALADAKPGSDQAAAFDALGLSIKDLKALDPVEAFQKIAVALQGFANDANKARLVQELFGRSLREVAPLLKDAAEAGKLVGTVTKEQADEAERFNKELFALQKNIVDAARALTGPLISAINETTGAFRSSREEGKSWWSFVTGRFNQSNGVAPSAAAPRVTDLTAGIGGREFNRPLLSLPATVDGGASNKAAQAAAKAAEERRRLAEFSARQIVDIEAQAAQDTADAWKFWERQQLDDAKERAEAAKEQWRQVFEFIDQQQEDEIAQGQQILDVAQKTADGWSVFADQAARNIQDAIGNTLEATLSGSFDSIGQMWKSLLLRMASEAAAARIAKELFGDFGTGGGIGGSIGSLLALLPKFDAGTPFVPRDMIAMVHRGERIVPAAENARSGRGGGASITYAPVIQIDSRTDQAQVAQLVSAGVQQGQRQLLAHLKASGVTA